MSYILLYAALAVTFIPLFAAPLLQLDLPVASQMTLLCEQVCQHSHQLMYDIIIGGR
jgi:hypothetical protein